MNGRTFSPIPRKRVRSHHRQWWFCLSKKTEVTAMKVRGKISEIICKTQVGRGTAINLMGGETSFPYYLGRGSLVMWLNGGMR